MYDERLGRFGHRGDPSFPAVHQLSVFGPHFLLEFEGAMLEMHEVRGFYGNPNRLANEISLTGSDLRAKKRRQDTFALLMRRCLFVE
jgi:hypothetical protein